MIQPAATAFMPGGATCNSAGKANGCELATAEFPRPKKLAVFCEQNDITADHLVFGGGVACERDVACRGA